MSSKLVKQQLASVLHKQQKASEQQQPGGAGKGKGKQADSLSQRLKRVKRRRQAKAAPSEEQRQQEVLAANIKYYAKTVEAKGPAAELVAQALAKKGFQPRPRAQRAQQQPTQQAAAAEEWDDDDDLLAEFGDLL